MADEEKKDSKIKDTADAVRGLFEAVPIYQDALQPAAKETGKALSTIGRAINAALIPLEMVIWGLERFKRFFEEDVAERLKAVPAERIVTPSIAIAGPLIEAVRYAGDDPDLRDMYASLLAQAMDSDTAAKSHPAYVEVLRQLTPAEAQSLQLLAPMGFMHAVQIRLNKPGVPQGDIADGTFLMRLKSPDTFIEPVQRLTAPDGKDMSVSDFNAFGENIGRLGIVLRLGTNEAGRTDLLQNSHDFRATLMKAREDSANMIAGLKFQITTFGADFCKACGIQLES